MTIYDFVVKNTKQEEVSLKAYKGKVLLIVNTATSCGFTPQYEGLEKLYELYGKQGFEVLDFPCNQFMNQAKGTDQELASFCQLKYHTTFQTFAKLNVNGKEAHPLFKFLKHQKPTDFKLDQENGSCFFKSLIKKMIPQEKKQAIKWNFTKFLVGRDGKVIERFGPTFKPEELNPFIEKLL
jgi:glutathione peroxidase